ncbi:autotransporter-associated N-terminal domain-containing protein, partial [Fusobacterium vincentii]
MNNNLDRMEQSLRSIAKRYKTIKYSIGLAILFLMIGGNAFSQEINGASNTASTIPTTEEINSNKNTLRNSIGNLKEKIKSAREENNKKIIGEKLELIQLMEQGDQVVKSPWNSWQFGANYFYNNWRGTFEGKGDKKEKYPFEGVFTRSDDLFLRYIHPDSKHYEMYTSSLSTVSHSLSTFSAGSSTPQKTFAETPKPVGKNRTLATTSSRGGDEDSYGLANSRIRQEDISKIELGVTIRPRQVNKDLITIQAPDKPVVNRPVVTLPESPSTPEAPTPPTLSLTPFEPVAPKSPEVSLEEAPIFNIKLGSFRNHMTQGNNVLDGNEDGGGLKGDKANAKSYEHNGNKEIGNSDLGTYATRYAWGSPSKALNIKDGFDSALLKVYFDYGKANGSATGGGTLTIKEEVNKTIDSINRLKDDQKAHEELKKRKWNTGKFLTGGSRFASMDNAVNAKIVNKGTINLAGPLVVGFEIQSDTIGSGKRTVENDGTITDEIEEGYRDSEGLGGLKVGKVDEDGNVVESADDSTELTLPPFARESSEEDKLKIKRTPDIVSKNDHSKIIKKGGYTGYKVGMILTYENNDDRKESLYSLINDKNGKIKFNGDKSIGIQIFAPRSYDIRVDVKNKGIISIGGIESYGIKISSRIKRKDENAPAGTFIGNDEGGIINVSGGNGRKSSLSSGMAVIEDRSLYLNSEGGGSDRSANNQDPRRAFVRAYKDYVKNKGTIKVSGGTGNTGMFLKLMANDDITNEGLIDVSGLKNIGMRVTEGELAAYDKHEEEGGEAQAASAKPFAQGDDTDEDINIPYYSYKTPIAYNKKEIKLSSGEENIGMVSEGDSIADNTEKGKITIAGGNKNIGMLSEHYEEKEQPASLKPVSKKFGKGYIVNRGIIETGDNSTAKNAIGMAIKNGTTGVNTGYGKIDLKGEGSVGVYNDNSNFEMRSEVAGKSEDGKTPSISVSGKNTIGVYAKGNKSTTKIKS